MKKSWLCENIWYCFATFTVISFINNTHFRLYWIAQERLPRDLFLIVDEHKLVGTKIYVNALWIFVVNKLTKQPLFLRCWLPTLNYEQALNNTCLRWGWVAYKGPLRILVNYEWTWASIACPMKNKCGGTYLACLKCKIELNLD